MQATVRLIVNALLFLSLLGFPCATRGADYDQEDFKAARRRAEQGEPEAELALGIMYSSGQGVVQNFAEAIRWYQRAAAHGNRIAQNNLGIMHLKGQGVPKNPVEAANWIRKSAEQGYPEAQLNLGSLHAEGRGVSKNYSQALAWFRRAAEQGDAEGQRNLGAVLAEGEIVRAEYVEAYQWLLLSAAQGSTEAAADRDALAKSMTPPQIAESQRLATTFVAKRDSGSLYTPKASGTGFFITKDAYLVTAYHVVDDASRIVIKTRRARFGAQLVKADKTNDIALLRIIGAFPPLLNQPNIEAKEAALYKLPDTKLFKVAGDFSPLPITGASGVMLGEAVSTIGFPNLQIQGSEPKFTRGEVNGLAGIRDDARYFQISTPVQPGNSGGPLLDAHGNVIGLVVSRLNDVMLLRATGTLPQNVNYALKSTVLVNFLKSVPGMKQKLESSSTAATTSSSDDWLSNAQKSIAVVLAF